MLNSSTTAEQEKMKEEMAQHKRRLELIFTDCFLGLKIRKDEQDCSSSIPV